jgi:thermosome
MNIRAAKAIAEIVRTTLGPRGMDKMMVDDLGDIVVTNDGVTIVDEIKADHPAAKMVVEVAKTQDEEVGDGTTTAVVLTGELLAKAEALLEQGIHPTIIAKGYRMASEKALETLNTISDHVTLKDEQTLEKIAVTAMTGKGVERSKELLAGISVKAVKSVAEEEDKKIKIDLDNIQVEKKTGSSVTDTELILGIIIDKEVSHDGMPKKKEDAKIALIDSALEIKKTETDAKIRITSPEQLASFNQQEEKMLKAMADAVAASGANVLFCQKGIDDMVLHYLSKGGVLAAKSLKKSDMEKLAKATGARITSNPKNLEKGDLGKAKTVEERKIAGDKMIFVSGCKNPKAVSILVRGGTEHVAEEAKRAIDDALGGVAAALEVGKIVAGGGAPEIEVAQKLREYAEGVGGREQLAINAFADAVEIIPRTLAESAGMDAIDVLVSLRSQHDKKQKWAGVDVFAGKTADMKAKGIVEPLKIKTQAVKSSSEAAEMILRIDDIIAASKKNLPAPPPGGGGMGGMPGMM